MFVSPITCLFYRVSGTFLSSICVFTIILVCRYFIDRYRRYPHRLPLSPILIGILISFIMILWTGIPLVLIQCFTCRPFRTYAAICQINVFICFTVGTFNMYILALLSVFRYLNIGHQQNSFIRFFEHYRGLSVILCALISLCWSFPPLINVGNTYTDKDIGFHCTLDWNNSAFQSRLYVSSLLACNYFLLLFVIIYSNLRIYFILRYLLQSKNYFNSLLLPPHPCVSAGNSNSSANLIHQLRLEPDFRKYFSDKQLKQKLNRLQRLKLDRRYARIIAIMVTQFLIAWTPYAIVAMILISGYIEIIHQYPLFLIISELLAKFSLVLNPLILIYTSKMRLY